MPNVVSGMRQQGSSDGSTRRKLATQDTFGFEWKLWSKLPEHAENHFYHVVARDAAFFAGKCGWDPAMGMGRDAQHAAAAAGDNGFMRGSDLSYAVDVAYQRRGHRRNVLIVQAGPYTSPATACGVVDCRGV